MVKEEAWKSKEEENERDSMGRQRRGKKRMMKERAGKNMICSDSREEENDRYSMGRQRKKI